MTKQINSKHKQVIPQKRFDFLARLHKTIVDYYSDHITNCATATIEVIVRIDGDVVDFIHPDAFELFEKS